jgi:hypothetical protein
MKRLRWLAIGLLLAAAGCAEVPYYARRDLGRRVMQVDANELETKFQNKILAAREVSGGRPGNSAGGGCGCGN